jgi:hypothetical protein
MFVRQLENMLANVLAYPAHGGKLHLAEGMIPAVQPNSLLNRRNRARLVACQRRLV